MLIKILTVFFCFLDLMLNIQLMSLILNYKVHNFKIINGIMGLICVFPSFFLMDNTLKINFIIRLLLCIIYYLGRLCLYCIIYRKLNLRIFYVFLLTINIPQIYLNIFKVMCSNYILANMLAFLTDMLIVAFLLVYIKKKDYSQFINGFINTIPARVFVLILVLTYIAAIFVMGETKQNYRDLYFKIFLLPSMIGLVAATISIIKISISETEKKAAVDLLSKQVENQIEYYEKINKIYDEFRNFRHDFKNHILCLRALIAANEIDKAVDYMNEIEIISSVKKMEYNTGNIIIDALLSDKSDKAKINSTKLEFTGFVPTIGITNADLCIIIANAIDNAIEACAKDESDNIKNIAAQANFKQGYFFFKISNPIFEEVRINSKNKLITTKKDKERHGFGVANIIRTVNKYDGNAEISTDNNIFTLDIQLHLNDVEQKSLNTV